MLCMLTSDNKYGGAEMKCTVCGKKGHIAYKDNKPFCFKLKKDIKE